MYHILSRLTLPLYLAIWCCVFSFSVLAQQPEAAQSDTITFGNLLLSPSAGILRAPGKICLRQGLLEVIACSPGGKEHESLFVIDCEPHQLQTALLLMGLKNGPGPMHVKDPDVSTGDEVTITVEWKDEKGEIQATRVEDMVWNVSTERRMIRTNWVFTGSIFVKERDPITDEETGRTIFLADEILTLIATYNDPSTILDNPLPTGIDDTLYVVNTDALPPPDSAITLVIQKAKSLPPSEKTTPKPSQNE